jgi:hypothetical protein
MKQFILTIIIGFFASEEIISQTTQDTIDHPYFLDMMQNRANNFHKTKRAYELYFSNKPRVKGTGWKQFERWAENAQHQTNPDGSFIDPDYILKEYRRVKSRQLTTRSSAGNWVNLGPFDDIMPLSSRRQVGRVNTIGFHPTNPNFLFAGAPQGGFWVSQNKGVNWTSTTDNMPTLGVSDIAVLANAGNPVILIGTGDRDANDANGLGVYRSTDSGKTFTVSNTGMGNTTVNMMAVNPQNERTILAATDNGIYRSVNAGLNWTKVSVATGEFMDIKYCPGDSMTAYVTLNNGGNAFFHRSTNSGTSWTNVTTGISSTAKVRMVIGVSLADPNVVYLLSALASNYGYEGFYKSTNKGTSFVASTGVPNIMGWNTDGSGSGGQGFYDIAISCSNTDANVVYTGGVNTWKTTNGGTSFTSASDWTGQFRPFVHADIHYLVRSPLNNELYVGSDGGFSFTTNEAASFIHRNNGLSISQFYNLGVSQRSKTRFLTGAQDNGTSFGSTATGWTAGIGGDGFDSEISNFDTIMMFGSLYYNQVMRSRNNGSSFSDITSDSINESGQGNAPFKTVFTLHPKVDNILVTIPKNVWISKNVVTATRPSFDQISTGRTANGTAVRFSNINNDLLYVGWSNGTIGRFDDALTGSNPALIMVTSPTGSGGINDIETSHSNENVVFAARGNKVYRSSNKGASWSDYSGTSLPNVPIHSLVLDKNSGEGLYAGTAAGVWYRDSLMSSWILFNSGLPVNSAIRDMEIVYDTACSSNSKIFAATYGRGLWTGDLRVSETQPVPDFTNPATACAGLTVTLNNTSTNTGTNTSYLWTITPSAGVTFVGGTDNTSINPQVTFSNTGNYNITLKSSKSFGGFCSKRIVNAITVGTGGSISLKTINDTLICPGDSVKVELSGMKNYVFSPNNQVYTITDSVFYVAPLSATFYKIVGDINGSCKDSLYVNIRMKPAPNFSVSGNQKICAGDSTTITITGVDSAFWTPGSNLFPTDGTNRLVKIKPTASQNYGVKLKTAGVCDVNYPLNITYQSTPNYNITNPDTVTICQGDSVILIESGVPSNIWFPNQGLNKVIGDTVIAKPTATTLYFVQTSDTTICTKQKDSVLIIVKPIPSVSISGPSVVCSGKNIKLTASGASSYTWSPSTYIVGSAGGAVLTINPLANITYTVIGSNGICSQTATQSLTVGTNPDTLKYFGKTTSCQNTTGLLRVTGFDNFVWSPADKVNDFLNDSVLVYFDQSFSLKVVGERNGCVDSLIIPINSLPRPTINFALDKTGEICEGDKIKIMPTGGSTYTLSPNSGIVKSYRDSFIVSPKASITYTISGTGTNGCSNFNATDIVVNPRPLISVNYQSFTIVNGDSTTVMASGADSYIWSPKRFVRNDTISDYILIKPDSDMIYTVIGRSNKGCESKNMVAVYVLEKISQGLSSASKDKIYIYPNPTSEALNIESIDNFDIDVIDITGRIVLSAKKTKPTLTIATDMIPDGNYIVRMNFKNAKSQALKIQVKH